MSTRDRAMSARMVLCSTRGFPKAVRVITYRHQRDKAEELGLEWPWEAQTG